MKKLQLIRNLKILYPRTDEDYNLLLELGCPMTKIDVDYFPTLRTFLPKSVKVSVTEFSVLQAQMVIDLQKKFKHEVELLGNSVVLSYPKELNEATLEKAMSAIRFWYRKHFITLSPTVKKSGKTTKMSLQKSLL